MHRPVGKLTTRLRKPAAIAVFAALAIGLGVKTAGAVSHTPTANTAALATHCGRQHLHDCRRAIAYWKHEAAKAAAAVAWQRHERVRDTERATGFGVMHALRLASALYDIPVGQLVGVANCESHLDPNAKNRTSTASGLLQFLDSTWARAGLPGFSVFDPYANALAAARLVKQDGSWREWQCGWAAA